MNAKKIKNEYQFAKLQPEDRWKIDFIKELTNLKRGSLELNSDAIENDDELSNFTSDEIEDISYHLCSS